MNKSMFINVRQLSTGFIEVPGKITINIYAQGCGKKCPDCHNPDCQSFDGGAKLYISDLDNIVSEYSMSDWVCWLGGDAVYQPKAFMAFNKEFKSRNFGVALYTGKRFKEIKDLVSDVDIVIDGEWTGKTIKDKDTNQSIWVRDEFHNWNLLGDWKLLDLWLNNKLISNAS